MNDKKYKRKFSRIFKGLNYELCEEPLSQEEMLLFEEQNNIELPDEYKYFLMNIGNGVRFNRKEPYIIKKLFRKSKKTTDEKDRTLVGIWRPIEDQIDNSLNKAFLFDSAYDKESNGELDFDSNTKNFFGGAKYLTYVGENYEYYLVINGKHRGEVWLADPYISFKPKFKTFLKYLKWLTKTKNYMVSEKD